MNREDLEASVADWVIDHSTAARIFEELGIDYSCAARSLEYACRRRGLDPCTVLQRLREATPDGAGEPRD